MINVFNTETLGAIIVCLLASLIWAPIILLAASQMASRMQGKPTGLIWHTALALAIAPTLLAPVLATNDFSLRAAQAPLPPMAQEEEVTPPPVYMLDDIDIADAPITVDPYLTTDKVISAAWLIYLYGGALALGVWAVRWGGGQIAFARAKRDTSPALGDDINHWCDKIGVKRRPAVFRSSRITSVCMTGFVRPKIILPAKIDEVLSRDEIAVMCAHEIAHIKRYDGALFLALAMVRTVFWFNPAITSLTKNIELSAEEAADALVVNCGADRKLYATCFVEALKFAARRPVVRLAYAPSFTPVDREGRRKRLARILNPGNSNSLGLKDKVAIYGIGSVVGALAVVQAALAVAPATLEPATLEQIPLDGLVTASFGHDANHPSGKFHNGVDIKAKQWTKIKAPSDGKVIGSTDVYEGDPGWGKVVVIDHDNGLVTRYAHLGKRLVQEGDKVTAGDVIAKVGSTGRSTGPHLHFEVIHYGELVDPLSFLDHEYKIYDHTKKQKSHKKDQTKKQKASLSGEHGFEQLKELEELSALGQLNALSDLSELQETMTLLTPGEPSPAHHSDNKKSRATSFADAWNDAEKAAKIAEAKAKRNALLSSLEAQREQRNAEIYAKKHAKKTKLAQKQAKIKSTNEKREEYNENLQDYREEIADQIEAVREARQDLEEAQREGLPGVEDAIRELYATEKALKKAKKKLYTEQS